MIKKTFLKRAFLKTKLRTIVSLGVLLILLPLVLLSLYKTSQTEAAWMNDTWLYRTPITFTHNAVVTNTKVKFDIATDSLITAGKIQSDCGDSRFTDANGRVLEYYIDAGVGACNTNSTDYYVLIPTIANGSNVIYHYYGNPTVTNGTNSVQFDQSTTSPSGGAGTVGTETKTAGPVLYYKMDQGTDNTCSGGTNDVCDNRGTNIDGAISNGTAWKNEDYCISGKCLYFDGSNDVVTTTQSTTINLSDQLSGGFTFEAWIRPNNAGEGTGGQIFYKGTNSWLRVDTLSGGTLDIEASVDLATTDATVNVAGVIKNNQWNHVALSYTDDADDEITIWVNGKAVGASTNGVGSLATDTNDLLLGGTTTNNFNGFVDEVKVYNFERSTSQMALDATNGTSKGNSAIFGVTSNPLLSNGLVGNWEMDESAANTCTGGSNDNCDKSGNVNDGAWTNATVGVGLYSNGTTYDGTGDYVSVADSASLSMTQQVTVSAWVRPNSSIATKAIVVKDGSYRLVTDGSGNPICQVNNGSWQTAATSSTALSLSVWQHVVCIFDGTTQSIYINGALKGSSDATVSIADSANALRIGSDSGGTYGDYNGRIDSVRVYNKALQSSEVTTLYNWQPSAVGWWKMDEGTGQNIYDSSGNGYNGTLGATTSVEAVDPTWVNGRFGNAVSFDGSTNNKYVLLGDNDGLDVTTNEGLTISGWVRRTGNAQFNNRQYIYDKINTGSNAGYSLTIETTSACNDAASDGNLVCFSMSDGTDTYFIRTTSTTITADSTWHYVTATIDRDSETNSLLYIDGVAQAVTRSGTFASVGDLSSTSVSCIGLSSSGGTCMISSPTNQMNGDIDGVKIYKYPRTQAQIVEDMNSSHPAGGSPIGSQVIKWAFDEGQGTTANNQVSGGTAGTLTNIASPATSTSGWTQTGKTNKAIVFDGSNDAVVIATASDASVDFNGSEPFSVCSYVYPTTMAGSSEADLIVGKWDATTPTRGYRLYLTNDDADTTGNFRTEIYDESADQTISAAGSIDTVSVNTWYHVCMTFNGGSAGAADDLKLYVNSVNTASNTVNASFLGLEDVTADMTVGDYDTTDAVAGDTAFTGTIDEVQVYAGVLTGDQVKVIMNANAGINFGSTTTDETTQITGTAETGPILYMPFNEGTGTSALDRSGNDRTGTLRNRATWVNGKVGSAVYFDGIAAGTLATDTHVSFSADILDSLTTESTFETWFKPNDTGDDFQDFMAYKEEGGTKTGKYIEMAYERSTDKVWVYTDWATNCATNIQASVAMSGTQTAWHHFAFTMSTTGNALYIDGVKQTLTYGTGSSSTSCNLSNWSTGGGGSTYFTLGCWLNTATACYDPEMYEGALDEVKVFNYARTPAQIAYDVNRGAPIGWWKFDDCTGATAYDSSGNGNNATLTYGGGTYTAAGTCTSGTSSDGWYGGAVGRFNGGIAVDTTTDTISVGNITLYTFERTTPFTTSIWIKTSSLSAMTLMSKQDSSAPFSGWNVQTSGSGYIYLQLVNTYSSNTLEMRTTNSTNYSDGTWHHVVTTYDGTSTPAGVHIYFDGRDIALTTSVNSLSSSITNSILMYIGSRNGTAQKFDGLLDDARLYNYALTASQVKKLYNENAAARFGPATGTP